ncbi:glycosyltransferase family 2 protein [Vibrio anguillarum]|uniref:glycosyltransferase family 2 protein n=1 Tax=Vibrio anguillarum TaxID=55601 RepID=UPI001BE4CF28|nr:glycosyltransferase family 2 protein [Vibrio anguillarum]MCC4238451.1 glycosyltransferase family 2 protein [Vibrio anguillarum]MDT3848108.1 glycosyltransferase family 2 protein [Vibrio anguillarum]
MSIIAPEELSKDPIDLTIVIPCLNEAENIIGILDSVARIVVGQKFTSEIIVVDDESDDETLNLANQWAEEHRKEVPVRVISRSLIRRGYGAVVRFGAAHGSGRYCIFVSADMVDPIHLIPQLYEEMENGAILAQCSRYMKPGDDHTIPFKYQFFQFFFRRGVRIALGEFIPDSTYAFKMFRRRETLGVGLSQNRFSISPEITFKSILMGGEVKYIPGAQGTRAFGVSKFIFRKEGIGYSYCLIRAFLHRMKLIYWF